MLHKYQITGMTCSSCEAKVKSALLSVDNITAVEVSKDDNSANITMDKHVSLSDLQNVLDNKYQISQTPKPKEADMTLEQSKPWFTTYKPILVILGFILIVTFFIQSGNQHFDFAQWMRHFMAGFFLVFSFFKFLDLKGFAESYKMYDVIAQRFYGWGYIYAFLELALGVAYLTNFNPVATNLTTAIVMTVSIIGVLQTVLNKKKIQCACLGAVFNLPMSTVTIIEDGLMIVMSLVMLYLHLA